MNWLTVMNFARRRVGWWNRRAVRRCISACFSTEPVITLTTIFISPILNVPPNIARLFRATIGQGYAGGVQGHAGELVDMEGTSGNKYYKYYIPGVGTPFPGSVGSELQHARPGLCHLWRRAN
ncbi:lipoprotein [Klebsiella michiganensis]|uniref:Lipoprotein n=1 Tax=Klebsiella michiganensis TaxID=1134687 RepID=A0A7H4N0D9_9ENTR|nr:lipoprotein [Klebsiella michiganensis]